MDRKWSDHWRSIEIAMETATAIPGAVEMAEAIDGWNKALHGLPDGREISEGWRVERAAILTPCSARAVGGCIRRLPLELIG
jgi:hypothetical protein